MSKKQFTINKFNPLRAANLKVKTVFGGFVVLFSLLVSSIVVTISFGLLMIALKEIVLSSTGRESQFGFYAADAGAECALYWDIKGSGGVSIFPTSTQSTPPSSGVICGQLADASPQDITQARLGEGNFFQAWDLSNRTASAATTTFYLSVVSGKACSKVEVSKNANNTKIQAYGYNTCDFTSQRVIERGIRVTY
ncbi:MAG: hypothetical protein WC835_03310 [Candidatus Paceibacterota bacterium]|jgi:hypothetical protein